MAMGAGMGPAAKLTYAGSPRPLLIVLAYDSAMLQVGEIIDQKYRIVRELGSGAMGAVYEGVNVRIKRRVAIKVLHPAVAAREDTVQRFEREAQAAGRIGSGHIVEVLDLGTLPDGSLFMVMEYLQGMSLGDRIRTRGRLAPNEIAILVQQLLTGLEMAHEARIIHRDLKPDNIFIVDELAGQRDFVKILDFGVSKFNPLTAEEGMSMTRTGTVMGTPFYMSPEQAKGARSTDERSDLYAVGVIVYEAVTGQVPYNAGTFNELIFKIVLETPAPPETFVPNLDPGFGQLIRKAMAREPEKRFQTAAEFRDAISIWLHTGRHEKSTLEPPPSSESWRDDDAATVMVDRGGDAGSAEDFALPPAPGYSPPAAGFSPPAAQAPLGEASIEIPGVAQKQRNWRRVLALLCTLLVVAIAVIVGRNLGDDSSKESTAGERRPPEPSSEPSVQTDKAPSEEPQADEGSSAQDSGQGGERATPAQGEDTPDNEPSGQTGEKVAQPRPPPPPRPKRVRKRRSQPTPKPSPRTKPKSRPNRGRSISTEL